MRALAVAMTAALGLLAACSPAPEAPEAAPVPPSTTTTSTTTTPPPPPPKLFQQPYRYGTAQKEAPPQEGDLAPVVSSIETDKPYVFLTIDDGAVRHPKALQLIRDSGIEPSLFLNTTHVQPDPAYFNAIRGAGAHVHAHTTDHPNLRGMGYEAQRAEICGNADYLGAALGTRPTLFRPPFGNYDLNTRRAAASCGMRAVVLWTAAVNDGVVQFQVGDRLRGGDIVLMHFRDSFVADFTAFCERAKADGMTPVLLDDFLAPPSERH